MQTTRVKAREQGCDMIKKFEHVFPLGTWIPENMKKRKLSIFGQ